MTYTPVPGADATGANASHLPPGIQHAGYVTGSGGVPWTGAQFAADPGAVRIDQTPAATSWDATADVDDYENGAVQLDELAGRARLRLAAFAQATRPGQRRPAVYCSWNDRTAVANALDAGGVTSGVGLWVAYWGITQAAAAALIAGAGGPFPIIAVQYEPGTPQRPYDSDMFSKEWLEAVSGGPYQHTTDGKQTLGELAASRHYTNVVEWLDFQYQLSPADANYLAGYATPRAGSRWLSVSP